MRNILAKELKIKFVETLSDIESFSYDEGNPFLIKIYEQKYFVFLKNLSPAYFKNSPDVTRVQLPFSDHFDKIFKANIPFVILGYDADNDTVVCWNPSKIKERLNAKSNVSLYSRNSLQSDIKFNEFKTGFLSNGEKIILFRRDNLNLFFEKLLVLFDSNQFEIKYIENVVSEPIELLLPDKLSEITDVEVLSLITPLLEKNRVLEAVEICTKHYYDRYTSMTFKDWFVLINNLYKKNSNVENKITSFFEREDNFSKKNSSGNNIKSELNRFNIRKKFWQQLLPLLKNTNLFSNVNPTIDHWLSTGAGTTGVLFTLVIAKSYVRIELTILTGSKETNKTYFKKLQEYKEVIENRFGESLEWEELPNKKMSRIKIEIKGVNIFKESDWDTMNIFIISNLPKFENAFNPFIKNLR